MPLYEFRCICGRRYTEYMEVCTDEPPRCSCGRITKRVYSTFTFKISHRAYNPTVGREVTPKELKSEAARLSEEYSARMNTTVIVHADGTEERVPTGGNFEANFQVADISDPVAVGVTSEGLYEQAKAHHDMGNENLAKDIEEAAKKIK